MSGVIQSIRFDLKGPDPSGIPSPDRGLGVSGEVFRPKKSEPILNEFSAEGPAVRAVYPSSRHLSPKVRSFIDELLTAWRPEPPWDRP